MSHLTRFENVFRGKFKLFIFIFVRWNVKRDRWKDFRIFSLGRRRLSRVFLRAEESLRPKRLILYRPRILRWGPEPTDRLPNRLRRRESSSCLKSRKFRSLLARRRGVRFLRGKGVNSAHGSDKATQYNFFWKRTSKSRSTAKSPVNSIRRLA